MHTPNAPTARTMFRVASGIALSILLVLTMLHLAPSTQAFAATKQLVSNSHFEKGKSGWKTKGANQKLTIVKKSSGNIAQLTTTKTRKATLNDVPNSVRSAAKGSTYEVKTRVRTTKPANTKVKGVLQVRESASGTIVKTSKKKFTVTSKKWKTVTLKVTAKRAGSKLDLNVSAMKLSPKSNLQIKWVSAKLVSSPSTGTKPVGDSSSSSDKVETAVPVTKPGAANTSTCAVRKVPSGTKFGASASTSSQNMREAMAGLDALYKTELPIVRVFDPGMPQAWNANRLTPLKGRDLVMSFRPMPAEVLSGKHDAALRKYFQEAPSGVNIYWSYIHEPEPLINEGKFTSAQYKQAWKHIDAIADSVCRSNMFPTLILTGWTADPASKRSLDTYYPGGSVIDIIAFDPYNGVHEPNRDYYATPKAMFDDVRKMAASAGKPYAIAETGSRVIPSDQSPKGKKRAAWLTELAKYHRDNGAVFVTYFHSTRDGEWRLLDDPSSAAWRNAMLSSK